MLTTMRRAQRKLRESKIKRVATMQVNKTFD